MFLSEGRSKLLGYYLYDPNLRSLKVAHRRLYLKTNLNLIIAHLSLKSLCNSISIATTTYLIEIFQNVS